MHAPAGTVDFAAYLTTMSRSSWSSRERSVHPTPKAQPPRKRSGKRTARSWHSGKRQVETGLPTEGR